jgi:hypothetical protein
LSGVEQIVNQPLVSRPDSDTCCQCLARCQALVHAEPASQFDDPMLTVARQQLQMLAARDIRHPMNS